jgi:Spy/CpxP family protein refolding chaperone
MVAFAAMCVAGTASTATAQGGGGGGMGQGRGSAVDRWLTRPDTIKLTAEQQKKIDDIKAEYTKEQQKIMADAAGDRSAAAPKMAELTTKYQGLVKAVLTADQQAVFAKNLEAAAAARGRRGGT